MKLLFLVSLSLTASALGAEACGPCHADRAVASRPAHRIAAVKKEKGAAPAPDKAPVPSSKPETRRRRPALPRHLFM